VGVAAGWGSAHCWAVVIAGCQHSPGGRCFLRVGVATGWLVGVVLTKSLSTEFHCVVMVIGSEQGESLSSPRQVNDWTVFCQ